MPRRAREHEFLLLSGIDEPVSCGFASRLLDLDIPQGDNTIQLASGLRAALAASRTQKHLDGVGGYSAPFNSRKDIAVEHCFAVGIDVGKLVSCNVDGGRLPFFVSLHKNGHNSVRLVRLRLKTALRPVKDYVGEIGRASCRERV